MNTLKKEFYRYTDQIGITGSFICLIHCIITSGLMIGSTVMSNASHHHEHAHHHTLDVWGMIDLSMVVVSGIAVYFSTLKSTDEEFQNKLMWATYIVYSFCMLSKYMGFEPVGLTYLSYLMSFSLIGMHTVNLKRCAH
ncbi:MerC domain-containing protein [Flammeovirga sp. SJP92]|uniref:MerC domain-containing protein n=1 Tax=Flammeovirga sp. SJP92 TaxID=1775430 RepID=UPI0007886DDB|nr:MerC domain-containing protein [Flammeovirga sp. SJP92]KXX67625.1 hypothetical protein AVL50_26555 [Flammeovirga sp. SJP92]